MTPRFRILTASALLCLASPALAEVINISSNGFQIRHEVLLNIPLKKPTNCW
ncbi:hypothetical protein UNDYM_3537 [Undibacterium sp. YM2]|uniref:hypothetical protein n=1 Tax=Undibacterium sp. YM2 TaxID=2058625 RepID=UPI001331F856|nr:hypothetical protein [Undibacterium sp. YM2]BBB67790.1 hypothetical protein UNDYM_3537 [Undibacterium sp. YM2]